MVMIDLKKKLTACLLASALLCAGTQAYSAGTVSRSQTYGNWRSFQICFLEGCYGRATVTVSEYGFNFFSVDYTRDGKFSIGYFSVGLSNSALQSWGNANEDLITVQLRVDYNPIIKLVVPRSLIRNENALFYDLSNAGITLLNQLKTGNTLLLRSTVNGTDADLSFSLHGATNALNRAKRIASELPPEADYGYNPYFDEPKSQKPRGREQSKQQEEFF